MTWTVRVRSEAAADGIAIQVADRLADGRALHLVWQSPESQLIPEGNAAPGPSLVVDDALGRALLDALADHYGNTSGGRLQRADFEHERGRVDRLMDHIITNTNGGWIR